MTIFYLSWCYVGEGQPRDLLSQYIAILLPLNLTLYTFMNERGLLTTQGLLRLTVIASQAVLFAWLVLKPPAWTQPAHSFLWAYSSYFSWSILSPLAMLSIGAGLLYLFGLMFIKGNALAGTFAGVFLAVVAILHTPYDTPYNVLLTQSLFSGTGLMFIIAIVFHSYRMAYVDELTGLPSRRALKDQLLKLSGCYTLAMLDIDFFKKFNDTYGHDAGDQVLRYVATKMARVSGGGKTFRYGGEEFTIVFQGKNVVQAWLYLEEVCKDIASEKFGLRAKDRPKRKKTGTSRRNVATRGLKFVNVTVSIGVAEKNARQQKPAYVLKAADKALYRAKKAGRNRLSK